MAKSEFLRNFAHEFMKKQVISLVIALVCALVAHAEGTESLSARKKQEYQGPEVTKFEFETRFGWQMSSVAGETDDARTGFRGEFINLRFDARLYKGLSLSWRQRLNIPSERTFWDATDWLVMNYAPNDKWLISAGKQVVAIGGYEYDRAPIDLYSVNSEFWYNIACYQLGASVQYSLDEGNRLLLQFGNSPFRTNIGDNNNYAISLMWYGKVGMWETMWSANAFQTTRGRWMNYLALGNKFTFMPKRLWLEFDFMNRASSNQTFLFDDCSVIAEMSGKPHESVRIFGKYAYDVNMTDSDADVCVLPGTEMHSVSGGVEYEPFKSYPNAMRLFGMAGYSWGKNGNRYGSMLDDQVRVNVGVKLNLDILKALRWAVKKW